jgi:uncharacterized protein (TIGR02996 family)
MSTDGQKLYASILADPTNNDLRLIYADWLEENGGRDQAEFIRNHILSSCPNPHYPGARFSYNQHRMIDKRLGWVSDINRVLRQVGDGGIGQVNFGCYEWNEEKDGSVYMKMKDTKFVIRNGFVESVSLTLDRLLNHLPALVLQYPLRNVSLIDRRPLDFDGRFLWHNSWHPLTFGHEDEDHLPPWIFDKLEGYTSKPKIVTDMVRGYSSRSEAVKAFEDVASDACLEWAITGHPLPTTPGSSAPVPTA